MQLSLSSDEIECFSAQTEFFDIEQLKENILNIQTEACEVVPYPCIMGFDFVKLRMQRLPCYKSALRLGKEREGALFLDVGCCLGADLRKAVLDGFPARNIVAFDLHPEFWYLGHKLFKSSKETFPVHCISGDIFDSSILQPRTPFYISPLDGPPPLPSLQALTPLQGHVSLIHAYFFFHLFDEASQLRLARLLASLLSPATGSMIFGSHISRPETGFRKEGSKSIKGYLGEKMFCHSPESWISLWDGVVFPKGVVHVEAELSQHVREELVDIEPSAPVHQLTWCVKRL